jgi:hypothetical protein
MGSGQGKAEQDLIDRIRAAKRGIRTDTVTLDEARAVVADIRARIGRGEITFKPEAARRIEEKLGKLDERITLYEEMDQEEVRGREAVTRMADDAAAQVRRGQQHGELVALYSSEPQPNSTAVADLLQAGQQNGGYRKPSEGLDLESIARKVHEEGYSGISGLSNVNSTSNGLVNRLRDQARTVARQAYEAGYNVENGEVQTKMGVLARELALGLDSDSGDRDYTKDNMPRGMGYNLDGHVPGVDASVLAGGYSGDPATQLESRREALVTLQLQLDRAVGDRAERLRTAKARIEKEIAELKAQLAKRS